MVSMSWNWSSSCSSKSIAFCKDGSIDICFGPKAPEAKASNWIPTLPGKRFFLLWRSYGPERAVFTKTGQLPDMEEVG